MVNRGTFRGVYGLQATHTPNPSTAQVAKVKAAWRKALSGKNDVVSGRTEWRSEYDLRLMAKKGRTVKTDGLCDGLKIGETWFFYLESKK